MGTDSSETTEDKRQRRSYIADLLRISRRVLVFCWQVHPRLFAFRLGVRLSQSLVPLLQDWIGALFLATVAQAILGQADLRRALWLVGGLVGLRLVSESLSAWGTYADYSFGAAFDATAMQRMFVQYAALDYQQLDDPAFQRRLTKVDNNRFAIRNYADVLLLILSNLIRVTGSLLILLYHAPLVALLVIVGSLPMLKVNYDANRERYRQWDRNGEYWRLFNHTQRAMTEQAFKKEIMLLSLYNTLSSYWLKFFNQSRGEQVAVARKQAWRSLAAEAIDAATYLASLGWLLRLAIILKTLTLQQFLFLRSVITEFAVAVSSLLDYTQRAQDDVQYVRDYFDILAVQPVLESGSRRLPRHGVPDLAFEGVGFTYPGTDVPVLTEVSFRLEPGRALAIVGQNGAGKSTIIKLLLRLYDPTHGRITVNGVDLREYDMPAWYRQIGTLFQDFSLFSHLSAGENISFGDIAAKDTPARIKAASRRAGAHEFISRYEHGYDERLNNQFSGGTEPSGGQRQRIAIARTFYRNPNILVLDEPTSAIDAKAELEIFDEIRRMQQDRSTIIISHRFSTVRQADHILVMDRGRVKEQGSHAELMAQHGEYYELFTAQAKSYLAA